MNKSCIAYVISTVFRRNNV